jgi:D-amino-acid dehydrogenase
MSSTKTVVVGAGIVGLCTAYELLQRGRDAIVLDRECTLDGASAGNAGLFSIGHAPLTKPGASWRGLRWMLDSRSPLWIRPSLSPALLRWLWTFHRHCTPEHLERATRTLCALGWRTAQALERILDREGIDCFYRRCGWMDLVLDERNLDAAQREGRALASFGYRTDRISGNELRRRDPAYRDEVAGAIHYLDSAILHPGLLLRGLMRAVQARGGTVRLGCEVAGFERANDGRCIGARLRSGEVVEGDSVLLAAGIWSDPLASQLGIAVPMQAARGYHLQLEGTGVLPRHGGVMHETFVAYNPMGSQLRLAGTLEIGPTGRPWLRKRLHALTTAARRYLHGIDRAHITAEWAGYRPCTADGMPVIGSVPSIPGLFIGTGHAMMGLMLGPVTGRILCADICGTRQEIDPELLACMRPQRLRATRAA